MFSVLMTVITFQTHAELKLSPISTSELDLLIEQTDQLKTTDSAQFKQNISVLKNHFAAASSNQQEFIGYLYAYENVLEGDFEKAQQDLKGMFLTASDLTVKVRIKATLASIQAISREYIKSLRNLDYAINNSEVINDKQLSNKINLISAIIYSLLDINDMSLKYSQLVINESPEVIMMCKGSVYHLLSLIRLNVTVDKANMYETFDLCMSKKQIIYANLLKLEWAHKELEMAYLDNDQKSISALLEVVQSTESEVEQIGYNNLVGLKDMILAKALYYDGQKEEAIKSAVKSIEGSTRSGNTSQVVDSLKILQQEAVSNEDYEQAFQLSNQINQVENEIFTESKSKQMAYMTVKHNNLAKQVEIQQLKQNNILLSLENQLSIESTQKQQLKMLLIVSLLVILGIWSFKIKRKHDYFKQVSEIDHLTKVFTRKAFEERLAQLMIICQKQSKPINLAILDLDHFKEVNDNYGHLVGDWVLRQVVIECEEDSDQDVLFARLGGEEFAIVTPYISLQKTVSMLEKMRLSIANLDCSSTGHQFNVTASFGVTSSLLSGLNQKRLLTHADVALFEAKNKGRNQVVVFDEVMANQKPHHLV